ncbi:retrotransposon protein, putative, ty1-copia subclass [Tanacetum coccineum]|uniref:Retrotransposon protein, putative, ty1-copia subclass n=1 Tax=Tanacetum coccineum TaxID=301880 RepID=A0ABQ5DDD1_9ASTR
MHPGKSQSEYSDEFHKLVGDLAAIDDAKSDEDQAFLLLTSLPSSYDNIIETFLYGHDTLKLEDVSGSGADEYDNADVMMALSVEELLDWIMDSGGSYYITYMIDYLVDLEEYDGGNILLGDGRECRAVTRKTLKGRKQLREYQIGWKIKTSNVLDICNQSLVCPRNMGFNESGEYKKIFIGSGVARDREQHSTCKLFNYKEDSNEATFAVAEAEKIYAHKSLTFNNTVTREAEIWAIKGLLDKANGNVLGMEIIRDQSGNTLRGSLSRDCDVKKNGKWSCIYAVGSQEYQEVCTRLDIASADVGMLNKFGHGLQTDVQVFVDFDYTMGRSITIMGRSITRLQKEAIGLKELAIESRFELKIVAGIATGALSKAIPGSRFQHRVLVIDIDEVQLDLVALRRLYGLLTHDKQYVEDASSENEEGQAVSSYVLKMKSYIDNLERLGHAMTENLSVSLILVLLRKEYDGFVQNYNMHSMGKTVTELHAMLKLHEKTLPPKKVVPALHSIRARRIQKNQKKKLHKAAKGNQGKGKAKMGYTPVGSRKLKPGALSLYVGDGHRAAVEAIREFHLCLPRWFFNRFENDNSISVSKNNLIYFNAIPWDDIYEIVLPSSNTNDSSMYAVRNKRSKLNLDSALLWHCHFGHISKKRIEKLQHDGLLDSTDIKSFKKCVSCISRKMERKPYSHQLERAKGLLGLIYTNVCGPFKIMSRQGASYFVTFTDDFSRYGYVYLLKHKHEVFETFKVFQKEVENQLRKTIKSLRSDHGGEYMSQEFLYHLKEHGIIAHRTPPYTPQHNGLSKRRNRTLLDIVHSMMSQTTLPKDTQRKKIRYSFYYPPENKVFVARNAKFFENSLIAQDASGILEDLEIIQEEDTHPSIDTSLNHEEDDQEINEPQSDINLICRSTRTRRPTNRLCLYVDAEEHELGDLGEPANYKAALLDPESDK